LRCLQVVIEIFFAVFKDAEGKWDADAMSSSMFDKYQHVNYNKGVKSQGLLQCLADCIQPVQP
jgi:hypothetical protein